MTAAARALGNTRISRREQSPRRLQPAKRAGLASARQPDTGDPHSALEGQTARPVSGHDDVQTGRGQLGAPFRREHKLRSKGPAKRQRAVGTDGAHGPVLPRHVKACQHSEHRTERWAVWTWKRANPDVQTRAPYSCNSWRCPVCCRHEAAVTFARIKEASSRPQYDEHGWVYLCLTIDRDGYYTGRPWLDVNQAYRALSSMTEKLLKRLRREWSEPLRAWYAVVEAHKSGWPHVNLVVYAPRLARELATSMRARLDAGAKDREASLLEGTLLEHAMAVGWGRQSIAEKVRDRDALDGYCTKLAGMQDASIGELAKITQAPTMAPARFRRLRSAKGFLPPRHKNLEVTGALVRRRRSPEGDWQILRLNPPHDPRQAEATDQAVQAELAMIREEEAILSRSRKLPAMPPLRLARCGEVESLREATERRWSESLHAFESA